ncbi:hypothetical protein SDC9_154663 [bioreactor metagenome]|uniref:Uncharacterized protein n=1 Tax=bioreactor metagenome TaxID=1076179 RepID=A0A645F4A2_9ZZZZ
MQPLHNAGNDRLSEYIGTSQENRFLFAGVQQQKGINNGVAVVRRKNNRMIFVDVFRSLVNYFPVVQAEGNPFEKTYNFVSFTILVLHDVTTDRAHLPPGLGCSGFPNNDRSGNRLQR